MEILKKSEGFAKKVKIIRLINRKYIWETIHLNFEIRNKKDIELIIIDKLKSLLINLDGTIHPTNPRMPILYLLLKGIKPSCKINEKDLRKNICDTFPIIDVKVYQKFRKSLKTLDKYLLDTY